MEVFEEDIWISSFPKCGTTWTQEMVWNIVNDLDFERAKTEKLDKRIPFVELTALTEERHFDNFTAEEKSGNATLVASLDFCKGLATRPRIFKTHLDFQMLPRQVKEKKPKIIYVTRNPRDAVVSYYNHWRVLEGFTGSIINSIQLLNTFFKSQEHLKFSSAPLLRTWPDTTAPSSRTFWVTGIGEERKTFCSSLMKR